MLDLQTVEGFEWDEGNREKNWKKHKASWRECEEIFLHDPVLYPDEKHSQEEERFAAFGETHDGRYLTVVFTMRNSKIRIISARDMNREERKAYAKEKNESNSSF